MTTLAAVGLQRPARRRRLAVPATPTPTACTDGGIELQEGFACGTSVYDRGHGGQQRGYGVVVKATDPADDGTARWYVDWAVGGRVNGRTTAIKETYLEVALIPNRARCPPTAIGQRVLVVLGNSKDSTGEIVGKVGTCAGGGCGGAAAGGSSARLGRSHCCLLPADPHGRCACHGAVRRDVAVQAGWSRQGLPAIPVRLPSRNHPARARRRHPRPLHAHSAGSSPAS